MNTVQRKDKDDCKTAGLFLIRVSGSTEAEKYLDQCKLPYMKAPVIHFEIV